MKFTLPRCIVLAALLAGCATGYQPKDSTGGYSESALEPGVWRVRFDHTPYTLRQQIDDFTLLRSAELTLQQGYDYFTLSRTAAQPEVVVHMYKAAPAGTLAHYDARSVCAKVGSNYEVTCR